LELENSGIPPKKTFSLGKEPPPPKCCATGLTERPVYTQDFLFPKNVGFLPYHGFFFTLPPLSSIEYPPPPMHSFFSFLRIKNSPSNGTLLVYSGNLSLFPHQLSQRKRCKRGDPRNQKQKRVSHGLGEWFFVLRDFLERRVGFFFFSSCPQPAGLRCPVRFFRTQKGFFQSPLVMV